MQEVARDDRDVNLRPVRSHGQREILQHSLFVVMLTSFYGNEMRFAIESLEARQSLYLWGRR